MKVNPSTSDDDDAAHPQPIPRVLMLVDDEATIRALAGHILRRTGYHVVEASSGKEALELLHQQPSPIDLLVTDVQMPVMGGIELAEAAIQAQPELKVLLLSGYTDDGRVHQAVLREQFAFLAKPFSPTELVSRVQQLLG